MAAKLKVKGASEFMKMNRIYDKICAAKGHFSGKNNIKCYNLINKRTVQTDEMSFDNEDTDTGFNYFGR